MHFVKYSDTKNTKKILKIKENNNDTRNFIKANRNKKIKNGD